MILAGAVISILLWSNLSNGYVWAVLFVTVRFGAIGFYDDYLKVKRMSHKGFSGWQRLIIEAVVALIAAYVIGIDHRPQDRHQLLMFPFVKGPGIPLWYFFYFFAAFIIVGAGNSVNFTDGLDGLAIVPVMVAAACFGLIAYLVGSATFSEYLLVNFVPGTAELSVVCGALIGAGSDSCGSTPRRRRFSWAIPARWPWAARSAPSRSPPSTRSSSPSSAACSCSKRCR